MIGETLAPPSPDRDTPPTHPLVTTLRPEDATVKDCVRLLKSWKEREREEREREKVRKRRFQSDDILSPTDMLYLR